MRKAILVVIGLMAIVALVVVGLAGIWRPNLDEAGQAVTRPGNVPLSAGSSSQANEMTSSAPLTVQSSSRPTSGQVASESTRDFRQYETYKAEKSGLMADLAVGSGAEAAVGRTITVNYRGWLTDGRLFDDSYVKQKPLAFVAGQQSVIPGFEQGVVGMKVGGKRRVIVPPAVGYGEVANGGIPAGSVLVFDVELVEVK